MFRRNKEVTPTPQDDNPGILYIEGLRSIAEQRGISIEEAAEQTVQELCDGFAEEHIEPTLRALRWIQSHPKQLSE